MQHFPVTADAPLIKVVAFSSSDRVTYENEPFIPKSQNREGVTIAHEFDPTREMFFTSAEFREHLRTKNAAIHYGYHTPFRKELNIMHGNRTFDEFDDRRKELALSRQRLIDLWRVSGTEALAGWTTQDDAMSTRKSRHFN